MSQARTWALTGAVVVGLAVPLVGGVMWMESRDSKRRSAEATLDYFRAEAVKWYDHVDEENEEGHRLTFSYSVGGRRYTETYEEITWYDPGKEYKVCHDPADPTDHKLEPAEKVCGS